MPDGVLHNPTWDLDHWDGRKRSSFSFGPVGGVDAVCRPHVLCLSSRYLKHFRREVAETEKVATSTLDSTEAKIARILHLANDAQAESKSLASLPLRSCVQIWGKERVTQVLALLCNKIEHMRYLFIKSNIHLYTIY